MGFSNANYYLLFNNQHTFVFILHPEHHKEQETLEQPDSGRQCADGEEIAEDFKQICCLWLGQTNVFFVIKSLWLRYLCTCLCGLLQPKLTDEEGWKRFCLGETVCAGASSCRTDAEPEPQLDYSKVVCSNVQRWIHLIVFLKSDIDLLPLCLLVSASAGLPSSPEYRQQTEPGKKQTCFNTLHSHWRPVQH